MGLFGLIDHDCKKLVAFRMQNFIGGGATRNVHVYTDTYMYYVLRTFAGAAGENR